LQGAEILRLPGIDAKIYPKKIFCKSRRKIFPKAKKLVDRYGISPLCFIIIITSHREKAMVSEAMNTQNADTDGLFPPEMPALIPITGMPDIGDSGFFPQPFFVSGDEDEDMEEEDNFDDMEDDFEDDFEDDDDFDDDDDDDDDFDDNDDDYEYDNDDDYEYDDE
jgi:hypothetical protein